jgi:transposase
MDGSYDGRQIVGMDLHRRRPVLVRMTGDGRRLDTARIENSPAGLRAEIAKAGDCPKVVLEATYGWYWAADALAEAGAEVHLAHPPGVKAFSCRRARNDEKDAADLADLLRMGRLPEAWIAPAEIRELRELTRYRIKLVHLRTSCKDQVHAILAKLGVPVTCTDIFGVWGSTWLGDLRLPQPYAGKLASLRGLAAQLTTEITCWRR